MSNALLSDVEARAERRRTRTRADLWRALAQQAWGEAKAASSPAASIKWLERAHRLMPDDGVVSTALATAWLEAGALGDALALFKQQAARHGAAEDLSGMAACAHLLGRGDEARAALGAALKAGVPNPALSALAAAVAPGEGWCGLTTDGVLQAAGNSSCAVRLDGEAVELAWSGGTARLPDHWRRAARLDVLGPAGALVGSPVALPRFAGLEGFVEAAGNGIEGWAWCPADPARCPVIRIEGPNGVIERLLAEDAGDTGHDRPFARPRAIRLGRADLGPLGVPLSVTGLDGRHLLGSPIEPGLASYAGPGLVPVWADVNAGAAKPGGERPPTDIVIPVYRGAAETLACVASVLACKPRMSRVIVVDDASPDERLVAELAKLAARRRITLLRQGANRGFPAAANAGIAAAVGRDVLLLNSDTLVPPGAIERLRAAAYGADDIGSVTPLTNDGTVVSYPDVSGANPAPDLAGASALQAFAEQANLGQTVDLPVGVGFCLYLRRDCLDQVGLLREDVFAQGYGEECDLCLRARNTGWRNVAALDAFVAHLGGTSFGQARKHLMRRNAAVLNRLHPGYDDLVARHVRADPLHPARRRMDILRWRADRGRRRSVLIVTHAGGGGVEQVVSARARAIAEAGRRAIILRPHRTPANEVAMRVEQAGGPAFPNLVFAMPSELRALVKLLRADRPVRLELHHMLGHHHSLAGLADQLGIELVSVVHDYARFCPRIALVSTERRYCGEPDLDGCEACIADLGSLLEDDPPVRELVERSKRELARAARVVAPSKDAAARMARHFPGLDLVVEPWEDDRSLPAAAAVAARGVCRVVVAGAIGVEKGYEALLGCVRDARKRGLALEFVVVGYTADDERLMAAGDVFVTGEYREAEAVGLIRAQAGTLAFIPSVWPETWCFALSRVWQSGLSAAVFDLGAQAERVRATGRGWVLPLAMPPRLINEAFLRLAPGIVASQSAIAHARS